MSEQTASEAARDLTRELERIRKMLNAAPGRQLQAARDRERIRGFVQTYFRIARPKCLALKLRMDDIDATMHRLLELANKSGALSQYKQVANRA
ncbi:MAG: hypothetical protein WDN03_04035 [Rhizomicrobium sp.]